MLQDAIEVVPRMPEVMMLKTLARNCCKLAKEPHQNKVHKLGNNADSGTY